MRLALTLLWFAVLVSVYLYSPLVLQCSLRPQLVLAPRSPEEQWVERQVAFRYGVHYADALHSNWTLCRPKVPCLHLNESHDIVSRHLTDRHNEALFLIQSHDSLHRLRKEHCFPLGLEDGSQRTGPCVIGHNRPFGDRSIILIPLLSYASWYSIHAYDEIPWEAKVPRLLWRGSTTGAIVNSQPGRSNRFRIVESWWKRDPNIDLALTKIVQVSESDTQRYNLTSYLAPEMPLHEQRKFKYLLSVEGNDWASNLPWVLSSNSVAFCIYPFSFENIYWGTGLLSWVHFVPVAIDASDLSEKLQWCQANDAACREISQRANEYIKPFLNQTLLSAVMDRWVELWDLRL